MAMETNPQNIKKTFSAEHIVNTFYVHLWIFLMHNVSQWVEMSKTCQPRGTRRVFIWLTWWRHQMETFSASLALCTGNSLVTGEFPSQRPVMRNFDVFFDLRMNKWLRKQSRCWWFETPLCSLRRHYNVLFVLCSLSLSPKSAITSGVRCSGVECHTILFLY